MRPASKSFGALTSDKENQQTYTRFVEIVQEESGKRLDS